MTQSCTKKTQSSAERSSVNLCVSSANLCGITLNKTVYPSLQMSATFKVEDIVAWLLNPPPPQKLSLIAETLVKAIAKEDNK